VRLSARVLALSLCVCASSPALLGCSRTRGTTSAPEPAVPTSVANLDQFAINLNQFAMLPTNSPRRAAFRGVLLDFLVRYMDRTLREQHPEEATNALQYAAALWRPAELRAGRSVEPGLTAAAHRVYAAAARRGDEAPALFAVAIQQQFGDDATRSRATVTWVEIEGWLVRNGSFSDEPVLRHEELEAAIEETAANFPAPFVVQRLADLYVARFEAAVEASSSRENPELGIAARHRAEVTGYLLTRLYLRADDFDGAIKALARVELDIPTRKLVEFLEGARAPHKSAGPLLTLAAQFIPDDEADENSRIPPSFITQGWGIVENLARRAVDRYPDDAFAHLLLARAFRQQGLIDAAVLHLDRTVELKPDIFDAWQELAILKQSSLERLAGVDADAAMARLPALEKFHARAIELWSGRPIRPGLAEAYYTVGHGLYGLGRVDEAKHLLEKSIAREPIAEALDLLATIDLKTGALARAAERYESLLGLPFEDQRTRLRWEVQARMALALIRRRLGDEAQAKTQLDTALRQLNRLIGYPGLDPEDRSARLVERGKLMFYLGDPEQGAEDFRQARDATPGRDEAYSDPMQFVVNHGYYELALDIYRQALPRDDVRASLKLYFSLWLHELALRQGREQDPAVLEFLAGYGADSWQGKLAQHAQGKLSYDDLLRGASDSGEQAEAYFYEGLRRWRSGDPGDAKLLMRKVIGTGRMAYHEYDMAQNYLEWNDLPARARAPR
jgi:tetratricopeptide (TPR) repeat protein